MGLHGHCGHLFKGLPARPGLHFDLPLLIRNTSALTGACLLLRRELFWEVGGFDEDLGVAFQDIDLCLKLHQKGYRNIYTPFAKLKHHESFSKEDSQKVPYPVEIRRLQEKWKDYMESDPYYNPNLSRKTEHYDLDLG